MGQYKLEDLSKDDLRSLVSSLHSSTVPIFLFDPKDNRVVFANKAWTDHASRLHNNVQSGMTFAQAIKIETDNIAPDLPADVREKIVQSFSKIVMNGGEYEFGAPDGKLFRGHYSNSGDSGILGVSFDVTEIKTRRKEARQAKKNLEATLDGLDHGVMIIDETGHVSYANEAIRAFAEETGVTIEKGTHYSKIRENVPHQDPEGHQDSSGNFEYVVKGQTDRSFMVRRTFLENIGILVSTVEITELEEQRAQTNRFSDILERSMDGMPHGVLLYDRRGDIQMFNTMFEQIMGAMEVRVEKGMNYLDVSSQLPKKFQKELRGKDPGSPFELFQKTAEGKTYLIEGRPIEGVGFLITIVEITQLQEAIEAAKAADIAKSSFLANMSHEIRTPMNGVLGMAQVLEQTQVNDHQQKCINVIKESSELLLRIINDILDISKLDAEKVEIDLASFDLDDVINSAVAILKPRLEDKPGLEIILDVKNNPDYNYLGDAGRIRQIIINLLSNGVKFTEKGHVKLTAEFSDAGDNQDKINFEIEDTGIGIKPNKIDQIFERFEQSDMSTTRQFGGTGLGLSISKKLATLMGGELSVCKKRTKGACFSFSITLPRQVKSEGQEQPNIRAFKDLPVLVIDDNKINHMVITHQLEPLKVKTFCVNTADKGLSLLRKMAAKNYKFPLVVCDYQMPGKTGYDFVKELRSDPAIADTPIVVISSADVVSRRKQFIDLGVKFVLEKPCSRAEFIAAAAEELSKINKRKAPTVRPKMDGPKLVETPEPSQGKRILIADDDPVNRDVFKGFMELLGYDYVIVKNGLEAVQTFAKQSFDFVLMDISMPVLGGMEATMKIREFEKRNRRPSTPIIAVTAHALKGDREKFLNCGMDDYLAKPILKFDLERKLDGWIKRIDASKQMTALAS